MKGIYFLIGIAIFVISALIFLNENSKFYEGFTTTTTPTTPTFATDASGNRIELDASGNPIQRDASGNQVDTSINVGSSNAITSLSPKAILKPGICPSLTAFDPGSMMCLSPSSPPVEPTCTDGYKFDTEIGQCRILPENVCPPAYVYSGSLTNPTPDAKCTLKTATADTQAPGATVADPSLGVVSNSNKQGLINTILNFSKQVTNLGGESILKAKLSPDDKTYLTSLWSELKNVPTWVQGGAFPYNSGDTQTKTQVYSYAAQYLAGVNWRLYVNGSSTMRQYVHDKIYGAPPPPPPQTIGVPSSTVTPPVSSQYTTESVSTSTALNNTNPNNTKFAPSKGDSDYCDPSDVQDLLMRVKGFLDSLNALKTKDPVILTRIQTLQSLYSDLKDMKTKIGNGSLDPTQIPIKVGDARAFLATSLQVDQQLPNLITGPPPTPEKPAAPSVTPELGQLMKMAQFLKGTISVSFDSDAYSREQMAARVDNILDLLQNKKITSKDARSILAALSAIQGKLGPSGFSNTNPFQAANANISDPSKNSFKTSYANTGYMPDSSQLDAASYGSYAGQAGGDNSQIRPGSNSMQTDDNIIKRGSGTYALYNYADVTGPDYKVKLTNLCSQITSSGLGTGEELGCLKDLSMVGNDYGWKGAYSMVCNRLQNTWGSAYPQMFGCPVSDPTDRYSTR